MLGIYVFQLWTNDMMTVLITCTECGSGIHVHPSKNDDMVECDICQNNQKVCFTEKHEQGIAETCPCCERKDFYSQPDFNRKIGVLLYLIPTAICLFVGLLIGIVSFFLFWSLDFFLFQKLNKIVICYKCNTIFRLAENVSTIEPFNHEMNDRIVYSDHNFDGKKLEGH